MWPFKETATPVDKKKKKVRKGLMDSNSTSKKPFAGSIGAGVAAKKRHKKQLEEALTYGN